MRIQTKTYFDFRTFYIQRDPLRSVLGKREIQTLLTVLGLENKCSALEGKLILDLGAGDQFLKAPVESIGGSYRALDIDECDLAQEMFPLGDNEADIVISLAVIEHLIDPSHFLKEIRRVLKPGGIVWLETPDIEAAGHAFWNDPTHVRPYTRNSLVQVLQMHGFDGVSVYPNYRCKTKAAYRNTKWNFFRARNLMPLKGTSRVPLPNFLKGGCTGLFAIGHEPLRGAK